MSAPLDFFKYKNDVLSTEDLSIQDIAQKYGTPLYLYSASAFLKPLKELQEGLKTIDHLVCFAVKSNSTIAILKLLSSHGAGMDLVSGGELFRAVKAGVPPNRIVFSGVGKTEQEMEQALDAGVYSFNAESLAELETLNRVAIRKSQIASVALRFNPDVDAKTHPYISTGLKKNKFGLQRKEILGFASNLKDFPGLRIKGISIHIGSQLLSLSPLKDAFKKLKDLVNALAPLLPEPLEFLDLGGGVGISYRREKSPALKDYCNAILKNFGPKSGFKHKVKILIEPGRTIAGNSGVLITKVLFRKVRGKKDFLVIDAAMNDLIRPALYGSYHEIVPVQKSKTKGPHRKVDVVGPICESSDCFAGDRSMPNHVTEGDFLAILSAGAYGFTMSSNYNTRPRAIEILAQNGQLKVIRERETYNDLIKGEVW